jgi:GDPmannose 4,6-dehydratase
MWMMLQQSEPGDYVIATGKTHSVREFCERAFRRSGCELAWRGSGFEETGVDARTGRVLIEIDPRYLRPAEVDRLEGDASKARRILGWNPTVGFDELVTLMVDADLEVAGREARAAEVSR